MNRLKILFLSLLVFSIGCESVEDQNIASIEAELLQVLDRDDALGLDGLDDQNAMESDYDEGMELDGGLAKIAIDTLWPGGEYRIRFGRRIIDHNREVEFVIEGDTAIGNISFTVDGEFRILAIDTATHEVVDSVTLVDAPVNTVDTYAVEFTHLLDQLKSLQTTLKDLSVYTTKLERRVAKDQKAVQKRVNGKRKRTNTSSSPTGFSKPGPVSDELRAFLKIEAGELVARTEVTKRINAYCKEHGLQGKEDKRILKPDKVLKTLLRLGKNDELTFFNLQKYMKVHFPKSKVIST